MDNFKFSMPAYLNKSDDGDWVIEGLASTENMDLQGERVLQDGIDCTPIDQGKGWLNNNHMPGLENLLGTLDSYKKTPEGLVIKGRLFKNKEKSKAVYEVMSSLNKAGDRGRIGLSIEGKILKRSPDGKTIEKCRVDKTAITICPVNTETWATLAKSLNVEGDNLLKSITASEIEFNCTEESYLTPSPTDATEPKAFSASEVVDLVAKALSVAGTSASEPPGNLTGGDALAQESLDKKRRVLEPMEITKETPEAEGPKTVSKKIKKGSKDLYKSQICEILDKVTLLYPNNTREEVWAAVKNRLAIKFPDLDEKAN